LIYFAACGSFAGTALFVIGSVAKISKCTAKIMQFSDRKQRAQKIWLLFYKKRVKIFLERKKITAVRLNCSWDVFPSGKAYQ
jgi:hypothetical protein